MAQIALQDYLRKIDDLLEENRLAEVVAHCRHILQRYPRHVETYRTMGKALLEQQKHGDAADIFYRVLSVDPEDFISHAGLAIIHKEKGEIPSAIWHMERAYEMDPYNSAIQRELRELYARRDGLEPDRIALTRGALARLYERGELFQQAAAELRQVLATEPDRIDLQTLLAETLWRDEQRVDAVEVCLKIVEQLPYAIKANAILAEVWLVTGRVDEARTYLQQLKSLIVPDKSSLDPESIVGRAFAAAEFIELPQQVRLEELDYIPSVQVAEADAEWVQEVGFVSDEADTDWLRAMDTEGVTISEESLVEDEEEDVLDWLRDVAVSDQEEVLDIGTDTVPDPFAEQPTEEDTTIEAAESMASASDDWLSDIDSSAGTDFWQAGTEAGPSGVDESEDVAELADQGDESADQPSALSEADLAIGEIAPDEAFPDWLGELSPDVEPSEGDDDFPDWLADAAVDDKAIMTAELPGWLAESVAAEASDDEPEEDDWLEGAAKAAALVAGAALAADLADDDEQDAEDDTEQPEEAIGPAVIGAGAEESPDWTGPDEENVPEVDAGELPDWLVEPTDVDELADKGELPDWLTGTVAVETDSEEVPADDSEEGDWLAGADEAVTLIAGAALASELADDEDHDAGEEAEESEQADESAVPGPGFEELPDWLTELSAEDELEQDAQELPDWLTEPGNPDEPDGEDEILAWSAESLQTDTDDAPASMSARLAGQMTDEDEAPEDEFDEDDWADDAAGAVTLVAGAVLAAELTDDEGQDAEDEIGQEAGPADLTEGPTDMGDDELPDWLIEGQWELEEQVMGTPEEPEKDQQDVPEVPEEDLDETMRWLEELAAAQEADSDEEPASLQDQDDVESEEPVSEDVSFAEEEIPDWLQTELDETLVSEESALDWDQEGEPAEQQPETDVTAQSMAAAEGLSDDDIPDWLRAQMPDDLDLSAPTDSGSEELDDFADSLGWLDQIAAGEGEAIDEPPTLSWDSLDLEAVDLEDAGMDEDMSWLEELAVEEDALEPEASEEFSVSDETGDALAEPELPIEEAPPVEPEIQVEAEAEPFDVIEPEEEFVEAEIAAAVLAADSVEEPDLDQIPEDPDEAMAWLEKLAARQGAPADELPSLSEPPETVTEAAASLEGEALVDWDDEQEAGLEPEPVEAFDEMALAGEIPEDPDEAMAWLEQLAAQQGAPEQAEEHVAEVEAMADLAEEVEMTEAEVMADEELEQALAELAEVEMPADDDEAMAWLIALAGIEKAKPEPQVIEEMPTPPTAHKIVEMPEEAADETVDEVIDEAVDEIALAVADEGVVEDEDEAMAWLEQLAARQGAALDELTSVEEVAEEVETPDWVSREAEEAPPEDQWELGAEAELEAVEEVEEELAAEYMESESPAYEEMLELEEEVAEESLVAGDEPLLEMDQELAEQEVEGAIPDWLSLEATDEGATDELEWLDTFGEADFDSWLEAEEQTRTGMPTPDVGPESIAPPAIEDSWLEGPAVVESIEEGAVELEEVEAESLTMPPISGPIDREKLGEARSALETGNIDQAIERYAGLIDEDQGLPMVIADLETATSKLGSEPKLQRLLGDAYMRNGQLQKALEMYRQALDHL